MQVLVETAAVANGGYILEPRLLHHMTDSNGGLQMDFDRVVKRQLPLTEDQLRVVQEGMWTAVNSDFGTATAVRVPGVTIAAKTGTAEFCEYIPELEDCRRPEGDEDILPTHAWFVAYAPYEAPEIAVVVFVYDGGEGSATALPVAKTIIEAYFTEIAPRPPAAAQP
jgi:penicillin-binding protein 2